MDENDFDNMLLPFQLMESLQLTFPKKIFSMVYKFKGEYSCYFYPNRRFDILTAIRLLNIGDQINDLHVELHMIKQGIVYRLDLSRLMKKVKFDIVIQFDKGLIKTRSLYKPVFIIYTDNFTSIKLDKCEMTGDYCTINFMTKLDQLEFKFQLHPSLPKLIYNSYIIPDYIGFKREISAIKIQTRFRIWLSLRNNPYTSVGQKYINRKYKQFNELFAINK